MSKYTEVFTIREVAELLGYSYVTIWHRCVAGITPTIRVKGVKKDMLRILKSDLAKSSIAKYAAVFVNSFDQ